MSRFDNELKELERVVKEKKQAISDADLELKQLEHDLQTLAKEKNFSTSDRIIGDVLTVITNHFTNLHTDSNENRVWRNVLHRRNKQ